MRIFYIKLTSQPHLPTMEIGEYPNRNVSDYPNYLCFCNKESADVLNSNLKVVISNILRNSDTNKIDKDKTYGVLYHITMSKINHFSYLRVSTVKNACLKNQPTYDKCIYYLSEEAAKAGLRKIKQCIFDFYESKEGTEGISRPDWVNEVWVESDNWEEYVEKMKERGRFVEYAKHDKQ